MQNILRDMKKTDMLWYLLSAPLSIVASTLFAMSLQPVIDAGLSGDLSAFARASVWAAALVLADVLAAYLEDVQRLKIKTACTRQLRLQYFSSFFRQRVQRFLETDSAERLSKLTVDAEVIAEKYCENLLHIYRYIWSLVISVAAIITARWELAVYVVVFSLVSVNLPKLFQKRADTAEQDYLDASNAHLAAAQLKKYGEAAAGVEAADRNRQKKSFAVNSAAAGISQMSFVLIIIFAMLLVMQGKLTVGYVMSVSQLLGGIMFPFEMLPGCILSYRTGRKLFQANAAQIREASSVEGAAALPPARRTDRIALDRVSFAYREGAPVLNGVSLSLEWDKKYALVGASGSGKSTLSKIIMGFLPPEEGTVTVSGLPLPELDKEAFYRAVSYQSQNVTFFTDTIRNNILLGKKLPESAWEQIIRCARLEEFLKKQPDGEGALITENGKNISGGEAQRIGLARCLAMGPRFMIFDEIAASLDNQNALEVEKAVLSLENVGMLTITHRIYKENMQRYNKIFLLQGGEIVEQGTWEELIGRKGAFYQLAAAFQEDSAHTEPD